MELSDLMSSELEIRGLHGKVDLLIAEEMKNLFKIQEAQMALLLKIEEKVNAQGDQQ